MAAQFDLCRTPGGVLVVVLQADLLDGLRTRVGAPLVPAASVGRVLPALNPGVTVGETAYLVMPQLAATLTLAELGETIGSLAMMRDAIIRALDALMCCIVSTTLPNTLPQSAVAETDSWARRAACLAVSALVLMEAAVCSIEEAVCCRLEAVCSVRALRSPLP